VSTESFAVCRIFCAAAAVAEEFAAAIVAVDSELEIEILINQFPFSLPIDRSAKHRHRMS